MRLVELARTRRYKEAVDAYENGEISANQVAFDALGYCYFGLLDYEKAIFYFRKAVDIIS